MKLSFKKIMSNEGTTEQVYPVVAKTEEEIEDVIECSVCSARENLTEMTFTVRIRKE